MTEPTIQEPEDIRRDCAGNCGPPKSATISRRFSAACSARTGRRHSCQDGHHIGWTPARSMHRRDSIQGIPWVPADLLKNVHGVAKVAKLDGDEIGYLVGSVAEIKGQR